MIVGIVGSEAAKFTPEAEAKAREVIKRYTIPSNTIVSGRSPLGGIDIWAIEEAKKAGCDWKEFPPETDSWDGYHGYKWRNLQIAKASDKVLCITVAKLPEGFHGMRFANCYHCGTPAGHHVKSGGCWTMKQAKLMGKEGDLIVICY